jgi:serine/threonine protein kinase
MDVELYQRAQSIFDSVIELPRAERVGAAKAACEDDDALMELVVELLELESSEKSQRFEDIASAAAAVELPVALQPGVHFGRYVVLRLLGRGGTAQVWEVMHRVLGSRQALKVLTWADPALQRRLLREARAQAALVHPNIVPVHDIIEVHGAPGLLMPAIDGPALDELLDDYSPSLDEALSIFEGIVLGVAHAHAKGMVHRDLKPGNVLMDLQNDDVVPRVTDFGLVKGGRERTATLPGQVMGTLSYAAPEQLRDTAATDFRADLWSLGVILVELVAGQRPFRGRLLEDVLALQKTHNAHTLVPESLQDVARRLLDVDPAGRPPSCAWVLDALPDFQRGPHGPLVEAGRTHVRPPPSPGQLERDLHTLSHVLNTDDRARRDGQDTDALDPTVPTPGVSVDTFEPVPSKERTRGWLLPVGVVAVMMVGVGSWFVSSGLRPRVPANEKLSVPVEVSPLPDLPESTVDLTLPTPPPAPVPTPSPEAAPTPQPSTPKPTDRTPSAAPTRPAEKPARPPSPTPHPPDAPPEAAPPAPAKVVVVGDYETISLYAADGSVHRPGTIPPGDYTFTVGFPERPGTYTGSIGAVKSGQTVTLRCDASFALCQPSIR